MDNLNSSAFPQKIWCSPIVYQLSHSPFVAFKSSPLVPHCRSNLDSGHTSAASLLPPLWSSQFPYTTIPSITFIRNRQHPGPLHLSPSMFQLVSKSSWGCLIPSSWIWVFITISTATELVWALTVSLNNHSGPLNDSSPCFYFFSFLSFLHTIIRWSSQNPNLIKSA